MWDLPGPGHEPVSPALAGGCPTTAPPGKSETFPFWSFKFCTINIHFLFKNNLHLILKCTFLSLFWFCGSGIGPKNLHFNKHLMWFQYSWLLVHFLRNNDIKEWFSNFFGFTHPYEFLMKATGLSLENCTCTQGHNNVNMLWIQLQAFMPSSGIVPIHDPYVRGPWYRDCVLYNGKEFVCFFFKEREIHRIEKIFKWVNACVHVCVGACV